MKSTKTGDIIARLFGEREDGGDTQAYLNIITYKTKACATSRCPGRATPTDNLRLRECLFYHGDSDARRIVRVIRENNSLNYSSFYAFDLPIATALHTGYEHCTNAFEFTFHPLNYKSKGCEASDCTNRRFCPHFHSESERRVFEEKRRALAAAVVDPRPESALAAVVGELGRAIAPRPLPEPAPVEEKRPVIKGRRYVLDAKVDMFEDQSHEFKECKSSLDVGMVAKYVSGFLNSRGGTLYVGITDEGFVSGVVLDGATRRDFLAMLAEVLGEFLPPIQEADYKVAFVPVVGGDDEATRVVIEVSVRRKEFSDELYFTPDEECYIKRAASLTILRPGKIKEILRSRILNNIGHKLDVFEGGDLGELAKDDLLVLAETIRCALRSVEEAISSR